jgi:glutathione S-transferase
MKLYYSPNLNPRVAVAVARYLDSPVDYVRISPQSPANRNAFRAINPNALVPVLTDGERNLWETDAIACRLSALAGSEFWRTDDGQPEMIRWISWATHHLNSAAGLLYFERLIRPTFSDETAPAEVIEEAINDFQRYAAVLDAELIGRQWLVGAQLSYADFRVATALPFAEGAGLPLDDCPNVRRWHDQLWAIDAWRTPFDGLA